MNKSSQIAQVARNLVGKSCYVWGAKGQNMSEKKNLRSWVSSMETADSGYTKEQNVERVMNLYDKLTLNGINPVLGFDCSGLVFYVYKICGIFKIRRSAESYYNRCEAKTKDELRAGDLVFRHNGTKIVHVGMYIGGGRVIHAKGRDLGVVEESLNAYAWNRFGKPSGVYDDKEPSPAPIPTPEPEPEPIAKPYVQTDGSVYVRNKPNKNGSILGVARNAKIPFIEISGTGWYRINWNGDTNAYITDNPKYVSLIK